MSELKKILHVEDEPDIREVTLLALESFGGFEVESCESGEQALLKCPAFMPDLILMDVMMPVMDGPTTLRELRKNDAISHIPIIFMTAKVMSAEIQRFKDIGAIDVIPKPFDPATLCDDIQTIWKTVDG